MKGLLNFAAGTRVLMITGILFLFITGIFIGLSATGFPFLDSIADPAEVRGTIAAMTPEQKQAHSVITGTLDVIYPISFGLLFAGLIWRFFGPVKWLAALVFLSTPADLAEGVVQILALNGTDGVIGAKAFLTPVKNSLFAIGFLGSLVALVIALVRRLRAA